MTDKTQPIIKHNANTRRDDSNVPNISKVMNRISNDTNLITCEARVVNMSNPFNPYGPANGAYNSMENLLPKLHPSCPVILYQVRYQHQDLILLKPYP